MGKTKTNSHRARGAANTVNIIVTESPQVKQS